MLLEIGHDPIASTKNVEYFGAAAQSCRAAGVADTTAIEN
jgi:hypothetical protein